MTTDRIKKIQESTAYPSSQSVQQALLQVWNECAQQSQSQIDSLTKEVERLKGSVRTLCIQHQQLLDKAIDDEITDEETDGYKQSIEILDEIRNLIN